MVTLSTLYAILKVTATLFSLILGGRKLYRWIRRKWSKQKPTA